MKLGFEHFYVQINLLVSHVIGQNFLKLHIYVQFLS